jgi:hypothetical protein
LAPVPELAGFAHDPGAAAVVLKLPRVAAFVGLTLTAFPLLFKGVPPTTVLAHTQVPLKLKKYVPGESHSKTLLFVPHGLFSFVVLV